MRAVLLGFGGWISNPAFGHTSILITNTDGSEYFLLDAGEGVYRDMCECGYCSITKLKAVILTHHHGDHILGLPTLVQYAKIAKSKIRIVGLEVTLRHALEMLVTTGISNYDMYVEFVPIESGSKISLSKFSIAFEESSHTVPSVAVRIEDVENGKCLTYSSDTSFSENVVKLARGCEVLIHEASFNDLENYTARSLGHSTISDCLKVAILAGNRFVLPVHFGPEAPRLEPIYRLAGDLAVIFPSKCLQLEI